jgi:hypothetical protein
MTAVVGFAGQGKSYVQDNLVLNLDASVKQSYDGAENILGASGPGYFANSTYWPPINGFNPTFNYLNAPDGTLTGVRWAQGGAYQGPYSNFTSGTPTSGITYCQSIYVKTGYGNHGGIWVDPGNNRLMTVDANSLTIRDVGTSIINQGVIPLQDGWYRMWSTFAGSTGGVGYTLYTADGGGDIAHLWGLQLERGVAPGPYVPTFGTPINRSNTWNDLSGNSNNATLNMPYFNEQGYFEWDGNATTSVGSVANSTSINFSEAAAYSIDFLAYPYSNQPGGSGGANSGEAAILEKWNYSGTGGYAYCIRLVSLSGTPQWWAGVYNGTTGISTGANAALNTWSHVTFVFDWPNSILRIYINGAQASTTTISGTGFSSPTAPILFGQRGGATADRFAGKIGHIRMYNKALSATEISQNFNAVRGRFGI